MTFQNAVTIENVLKKIHDKTYLLPAIQREFVWSTDQITKLFDSVLRGYPIGSFLMWQVDASVASGYTFYDFLTDYHQRDNPFATKAIVPAGTGTTAILDGQQRLTSLNVAIYGSYAVKRKNARWESPGSFPKKRLYLNLAEDAPEEELGLRYNLRFLTDAEAASLRDGTRPWYRVGDVLQLEDSGPSIYEELDDRKVNSRAAFHRLNDLYQAIRVRQPINSYLEESADADKVLDIFVRVNSGGTTLSYSDLLLSMATNQWKTLDAREEVRDIVKELNTGGTRQFGFSKDLVLKTALMIIGADVRFKVSNFTAGNMAKVEGEWLEIEKTLIRAANLLHSFGLSESNLSADSVLAPIAYYLHSRGAGDGYLTSAADAEDRRRVQGWLTRSMLKRGIWGSSLDQLLTHLRDAISLDHASFPVAAVEAKMATMGKSLAFDDTDVDELLNASYGSKSTFALLSILYPGLDLSKEFHQDHVFPKSRFTATRLIAAGIEAELVADFQSRFNLLPNLQLLGGKENNEKRAKLPEEWLTDGFPTDEKRSTYINENDLDGLPLTLAEFPLFFDERKKRMRARLVAALGATPAATVEANGIVGSNEV